MAAVLYILVEMNRGKSKTADLHAGEESLSFRQRDQAWFVLICYAMIQINLTGYSMNEIPLISHQ